MFQNSLEIYTDKGNQCLTMIQSNIFCMTKNEDLFWFLEVKHVSIYSFASILPKIKSNWQYIGSDFFNNVLRAIGFR